MKVAENTVKKLEELKNAYLDEHGREVNNPKPLFLSVTPKRLTIRDEIQKILRVELSHQAMLQGHESFEESEDFDVDSDFDFPENVSVYEMRDEEPLPAVRQKTDKKVAEEKIPTIPDTSDNHEVASPEAGTEDA